MFNLPTFFASFLVSQFTPLPYPDADFSGKTIIVTGANVGLGLEAARHFVRLNAARVILGCRDTEKGEAARTDIETTTGRKNVAEVWQVDLTSFESVKEFCHRAQELDRLDVVIENAGLAISWYEEYEGHESTITVNVISTFLMALLLIPRLRESAIRLNITPHLTIVASDAHEQARFQERSAPDIFLALDDQAARYQSDRYNTSKLLEILIVRELAQALTASSKSGTVDVILNTLTPGFCYSDLMRHATFPLSFLGWIGKLAIGRTTEVGSRTLVAAAVAGRESHGMYMVDCKVRDPSQFVLSDEGREVQRRVYGELLQLLDRIQPGIAEAYRDHVTADNE